MNVMEYVVEQAFILIPALYIIGLMLKESYIKDWLIPWVLLALGVTGAILILGVNIEAIIQGILVAGVTVYANQLIKQTFIKREEE